MNWVKIADSFYLDDDKTFDYYIRLVGTDLDTVVHYPDRLLLSDDQAALA